MRWFVDISAIGSGGKASRFCVDADQWQRALQSVRGMRGDTSPFSNFSIELLDDGYRAIDPMTRTRFVVQKAPEGAELTTMPIEIQNTPSVPPPAGIPAAVAIPAAASLGAKGTDTPKGRASERTRRARGNAGSPGDAPAQSGQNGATPASAPRPAAPSARPVGAPARPMQAETAFEKMTAGVSFPLQARPAGQGESGPSVSVGIKTQPMEISTEVLPRFRVVSERSQAPSDSSPITYREMALAVAEGTTEGDAEAIARAECEVVRASLRGVPAGQFIQLAIFDHDFSGKPKRPPLATLTFKDWQKIDGRDAEPVMRFPLRERAAASIRAGAAAMAEDDITNITSVKATPPPDSVPSAPLSEPTSPGASIPRPLDSLTNVGPPPAAAVDPEPEPEEMDIDPDPEPVETPTVPLETHQAADPAARAVDPGPTSSPDIEIDEHLVSISLPPSSAALRIVDIGPAPPSAPDAEPTPTARAVLSPPPPPPPPPAPSPLAIPSPVAFPIAPVPGPPSEGPVAGPPSASSFGDRGVHPLVAVGRADSVPPVSAAPVARRPSGAFDAVPPPPSAPISRPRTSGEELIVELFEALSDLALLHDPLEGADFVLRVALDHMPSAMAMISFFSFDSREFVVVRAAGENLAPGTLQAILLKRVGDRAEIPSRAMRSQHTVVLDEDKATDALANDPRWRAARIVPLHYMCAPVALGGRYLGLLEIANPCDGVPFSSADGHALTYMGQQLAEFLGQRDLVLDPERITAPRLHARVRRS